MSSENSTPTEKAQSRAQERLENKLASMRPEGEGEGTSIHTHDGARTGDVSAHTIGVMLGLATSSEIKLLEGKVDLLMTKMSAVGVRMEKLMQLVQNAPTGSDLERIDVQIGALKSMLRDFIVQHGSVQGNGANAGSVPRPDASKTAASRNADGTVADAGEK